MEPKPGLKTSELVGTAIALSGVSLWTQSSPSEAVQVAGVYATAFIVAAYVVSRGLAKMKGGAS